MRVELIGLKRWTLPMLQDSLSRYAPKDSLLSHSCAAVLRGTLHFADAAAEYYGGGPKEKTYVTVTVVEPQDSALIYYRPPYRDSLPDRRGWVPIRVAFEKHNQAFQYAVQRPTVLLADAPLTGMDTAANDVRAMRAVVRRDHRPVTMRAALATLQSDGNARNRVAAVVILSQFATSDSTWWALAEGLRDPDGIVRATSTQVLGMLTHAAARPVDWTPMVRSLRALLDGTNLFANTQLMETLAATRVNPTLASWLVGGGHGAIVLAKVGALDPRARSAAHNLLTQLATRDLGDDPAAWRAWATTLHTVVDRNTGISVDGVVVAGQLSRTIDVTVGQDIDVTLGNMGPAVYLSPPRISSGALTFLGVEDALPHVPAGVTQRFRFKAVRRGRAIVTFTRERRRSEVRVVEDTFQVRPRRGGSAPR